MGIALQTDASASGNWTRARGSDLHNTSHLHRIRPVGIGNDGISIGGDAVVAIANIEYGITASSSFGRGNIHAPEIFDVADASHVAAAAHYADALRVNAQHMSSCALLTELGRITMPIILTRAHSATVAEWLRAAEHIVRGGNDRVIMCESGIRTYETSTQFTLDVAAISIVKAKSHFPVIVDVSHAAGDAVLVPALAYAAIAAGADGIVVSVQANTVSPVERTADLSVDAFDKMLAGVQSVARAAGRSGVVIL